MSFKDELTNELEEKLTADRDEAIEAENRMPDEVRLVLVKAMSELSELLDPAKKGDKLYAEILTLSWTRLTDLVSAVSGMDRENFLLMNVRLSRMVDLLDTFDSFTADN